MVGDTGNADGTPQLHVEIQDPAGGTFTCASCTPVKPGQAAIDPYASLEEASPRAAPTVAGMAPAELRGAASPTLARNSGGACAHDQVGNPSGSVTLTLTYAPFDAVGAHGVGFNVRRDGAKLGDPANEATTRLSVSPPAHAGPLLVQVFEDGAAAVGDTLSSSRG